MSKNEGPKTQAGQLALTKIQTVWEKFDVVQDDILAIIEQAPDDRYDVKLKGRARDIITKIQGQIDFIIKKPHLLDTLHWREEMQWELGKELDTLRDILPLNEFDEAIVTIDELIDLLYQIPTF